MSKSGEQGSGRGAWSKRGSKVQEVRAGSKKRDGSKREEQGGRGAWSKRRSTMQEGGAVRTGSMEQEGE